MDDIQQLLSGAKHVLHELEKWIDKDDHVLPFVRLAFEECWNSYYALFESWKAKDTKQLIVNMSGFCLELERLKLVVGPVQDVHERLDQQIQQVKAQISSVGGQAALNQLNEAQSQLLAESAQVDLSASLPPSPTPRPERLETAQANVTPVSAEQLTRLLNGYAPVSGVSNEQLAHEVIIDPEFQLKKHTDQSELEARVRMIATKAFFDQVTEDLKQGHPERSLPSLLNDVRERLLSLVRPGSALHVSISDTMDMSLIEQQLSQNSFDFPGMLDYVLQTMRQICAPVRDEAIMHIAETEDSVQKLRAILETLDEMALDLANFRLRALRPHLIPIAVEYERGKFAEALSQNKVGLVKTRQWIQQTIGRINEVNAQRIPANDQPPPKLHQDAVLEEAFVLLLTAPEPLVRISCPETLLMDVDRMASFQNETQAMAAVAALVLLAKNFGHQGDLSALAKKLFIMLEDHSTNLDHLTAEIEKAARLSPERKPMIRAMVDKTLCHTDTVFALLMRRIGTVIRSQLHTRQFVSHETLVSYGLDPIAKPLHQLCKRVLLLAVHHWQVYAPWYTDIINDTLDTITSSA